MKQKHNRLASAQTAAIHIAVERLTRGYTKRFCLTGSKSPIDCIADVKVPGIAVMTLNRRKSLPLKMQSYKFLDETDLLSGQPHTIGEGL